MTRPSQRSPGSPAVFFLAALATSVFLVDSLPAQPSQAGRERPVGTTVAPASASGSVQVTSGDGPGAIDREAILEAARQVLGRDVAVEEVRLGELLDRLQSSSSEQAARLPHRWVILALARSMTGYRGRVEDMRLGEFLDRLRPVQVRTSDGQRVVNGAGLVDLARGLLGPVDRVDDAADPRRHERSTLQLQHAAAAMMLVQVRREVFGQGELDAVYEEARRRLLDSGRGDAAMLLDGMRWIEEEVAAADPKPGNSAEEIALLQEARLHAFGPEMADLLFSREEAMERYEIDRIQIADDPTLTDEDRGARLRARREALRAELAAEGTFVGFVDSDPGASPPAAAGIPEAPEPSPEAPAVLVTTQCDSDPGAVSFTPTVNPSLLNTYLENTPNISIGGLYPVSFGGVCVTHHLTGALAAGVATQNSSFAVTPSDGALQVTLNLGAMGGSLRMQNYYSTGCATLCPGFLCDMEESLLGGVIGTVDGSVSASAVRVTQTADTCVLGDCTAVHPHVGTTAQLSGFRMTLFGSCGFCFDPCFWPLPACPICIDPCSGLNDAITALIDWLVNIEGLIAGAFVAEDGSGTLINIFSSGIVNDGCLPIDEVIECRRAGAQEPALAGIARPPRGGVARALLWAVPVLVALGAIVRLRRHRKD